MCPPFAFSIATGNEPSTVTADSISCSQTPPSVPYYRGGVAGVILTSRVPDRVEGAQRRVSFRCRAEQAHASRLIGWLRNKTIARAPRRVSPSSLLLSASVTDSSSNMKPFAILTWYLKFQRENKANKFLIKARRDLCGLSVRPSAE